MKLLTVLFLSLGLLACSSSPEKTQLQIAQANAEEAKWKACETMNAQRLIAEVNGVKIYDQNQKPVPCNDQQDTKWHESFASLGKTAITTVAAFASSPTALGIVAIDKLADTSGGNIENSYNTTNGDSSTSTSTAGDTVANTSGDTITTDTSTSTTETNTTTTTETLTADNGGQIGDGDHTETNDSSDNSVDSSDNSVTN